MVLTMDRKAEQREKALANANFIRTERAAWKRRIFDGQGDVRATIMEPPRYMESASLVETLTAVNRVGKTKARKVCSKAHVSAHRELGTLTRGERWRVIDAMQGVKPFEERS